MQILCKLKTAMCIISPSLPTIYLFMNWVNLSDTLTLIYLMYENEEFYTLPFLLFQISILTIGGLTV